MNHEFGSFSENWEAFNAALVILSTGRRDEGIAQAKRLLVHIRSTHDDKSRRWIRPQLVRILRKQRRVEEPRAEAA